MKERIGLIQKIPLDIEQYNFTCIEIPAVLSTSNKVFFQVSLLQKFEYVWTVWHTHNSNNILPSYNDYKTTVKLKEKGISNLMTIISTKSKKAKTYKLISIFGLNLLIPIMTKDTQKVNKLIKQELRLE